MKHLLVLTLVVLTGNCVPDSVFRANLTKRSDIHIRPNHTTVVEVGFVLTALNKLDTVKQELGTTFLLYMTWNDPRLKWTPGPNDPEDIVFYVNEIWTPPLVVSNAIEDSMFLLRDDIFPMRVSPNGTVKWIPRVSPTTTCDIDISVFPVDIQHCFINITSWVHSTAELQLVEGTTVPYPESVNLDFYTADKSWELLKTSAQIVNQTGGYGINYHKMVYSFQFRRYERFYWVLLVIPGICLAMLQPLVFLIPPSDQGTKLSYTTTIGLAFLFYTSLLSTILPPVFSLDKKHVLGENFGWVMICGTVVTVTVLFQGIAAEILKHFHDKKPEGSGCGANTPPGDNAEGNECSIKCVFYKLVVCVKEQKDCGKCAVFKIFNVIFFLTFIIVYGQGLRVFLDNLHKRDPLASVSIT